jgi:NAD(P)-dependent dehydrogenase (short-subunit alcohol dehydrogenase family)
VGGRALALPTDVADADRVEAAAAEVEKKLGPIDIWINNAMTSVFSARRRGSRGCCWSRFTRCWRSLSSSLLHPRRAGVEFADRKRQFVLRRPNRVVSHGF